MHQEAETGSHHHHEHHPAATRNAHYRKNFTKFDCQLCYTDLFEDYHYQEAQRAVASALEQYTLAEEQQKALTIKDEERRQSQNSDGLDVRQEAPSQGALES